MTIAARAGLKRALGAQAFWKRLAPDSKRTVEGAECEMLQQASVGREMRPEAMEQITIHLEILGWPGSMLGDAGGSLPRMHVGEG